MQSSSTRLQKNAFPLKRNKVLLIAIYSHPEYYPPTLSAVENLSQIYDSIYILHRNTPGFGWRYPENVKLIGFKNEYSVKALEQSGVLKKLGWYFSFSLKLSGLLKKVKPDTVLLYDYQVLLSYRIASLFKPKPEILWYHNHDVAEKQYISKRSLTWWSWKTEEWIFPRLQLFTLPALERKQYFPMHAFRGRFFFLPNFPSSLIYDSLANFANQDDQIFKILFQGSIGPLHGLEELLPLLNEKIEGKQLVLVLKGFIAPDYYSFLRAKAEEYHVGDKLLYIGPTDYRKVIENGKTCHIGIGIHKKEDVMNRTLGTASNKIYEYVAMGLPVILYDNKHFREILGKYRWAFFTNSTVGSLRDSMGAIIRNYKELSKQALLDFHQELLFEHYFKNLRNGIFNDNK